MKSLTLIGVVLAGSLTVGFQAAEAKDYFLDVVCKGGVGGGAKYKDDKFYPSFSKKPHLHCASDYVGYHGALAGAHKIRLDDGSGNLKCDVVKTNVVDPIVSGGLKGAAKDIADRLKAVCKL